MGAHLCELLLDAFGSERVCLGTCLSSDLLKAKLSPFSFFPVIKDDW